MKDELENKRAVKKKTKLAGTDLVMNKNLYFFLIPGLVLFIIFWLWPFFKLFQYSVTDFNGINQNYNIIGFANYQSLIKTGELFNSLNNTLIYTGVLVVSSNLVGLGLALLLNSKLKGTGFYRSAFYIPTLFSAIVVGFIWSYVYMPQTGMLPSIFSLIGAEGNSLNILGDYDNALYGIIIVDIWKNFGQTMIIYLAGLQTISDEYLEAARIDGATEWEIISKIKIPLLAPTITINIILNVISGLKAFDYPFIMTNGGPGKSTNTMMFTVFRMAFNENQFGKSAAFSVMSFLVIIIIAALLLLFLRKKERNMR